MWVLGEHNIIDSSRNYMYFKVMYLYTETQACAHTHTHLDEYKDMYTNTHTHTYTYSHSPKQQTEKARHILQVRQKILDLRHFERGLAMPTDQELNKLSDEHKAMLAQKCVDLLTRGKQDESEVNE